MNENEELTNNKPSVIEKNIGTVLSALVVSFIVGTVAMIYNSDKNFEVYKTKMDYMNKSLNDVNQQLQELQGEVRIAAGNRWTRDDHYNFEKKVDNKFNKLENRILRLEDK